MSWVAVGTVGSIGVSAAGGMLSKKKTKQKIFDPRSAAQKQADDASAKNFSYWSGEYQNRYKDLQGGSGMPAWYQNQLNDDETYQRQQAARNYFGNAGDRQNSAYGMAMSGAQLYGMNPRALASQLGRLNTQYTQSMGDIAYQKRKQGTDYLTNMEQTLMGGGSGMKYSSGQSPERYTVESQGKWAPLGNALQSLGGGMLGAQVNNANGDWRKLFTK